MASRLSRLAVVVMAVGAGAPAFADGDEWVDPLDQQIEERVKALEEAARTGVPPATTPEELVRWSLDHGEARFVGALARVDVTLEIRSDGGPAGFEWSRRFAVDPRAEVVGASLERPGAETIAARTLTLDDARRIYGESRTPPTPTFPRGRDPLRVERTQADRLDVTVFPVNPGERVRVHITFVTPLRGRGTERVYVDPLDGISEPSASVATALETDLLVEPGPFTLTSASSDLLRDSARAGLLRFVGAPAAAPPSAPEPTDRSTRLVFRAPRGVDQAVAVRGGGLGTRVASWWFDPAEALARHGIDAHDGVSVRLLPVLGSTSRVAPDVFDATAEPMPVTARLGGDAADVRYVLEVRSGDEVVGRFDEALSVDRTRLSDRLEDALTAWHRCCLVARAFRWAEDNEVRVAAATAYAVDAGVLVPGTAALAIPPNERTFLSRESRHTYDSDGAPLGAPNGEADLKSPPSAVR